MDRRCARGWARRRERREGGVEGALWKQGREYDPSDREANDLAVANGYKVLHVGAFSKAAWENVRSTGFAPPAGKVTPSPKPFDPEGAPAEHVTPTASMMAFSRFCKALARRLIEIDVVFLARFNAAAAYGDRRLSFNVGRLGRRWFEGDLRVEQLDLVLHELGHEKSSNHLSREFSDALTRLGAQTAFLARENPDFFDLKLWA